jgi:hypothetical protein
MTQFTKGPWKWATKDGNSYLIHDNEENNKWPSLGCIVDDGSAGGEYGATIHPDDPNAHLIAAAPDMYEALQSAHEVLKALIEPNAIQQTTVINTYAQAVEAEQNARAALAKAEGK